MADMQFKIDQQMDNHAKKQEEKINENKKQTDEKLQK